MTKYFEDLLKNLRDTNAPTTNQHHLFLLGTGVDYTDRPTKKEVNFSYTRGETFSYAAQLVTHVLGEQDAVVKHADALLNTENFAHAYHSPSVDVINGADLLGFGVGDRIAKGLMLTLGAVAQGKTELHVSGFSRGGVESIVLMHELERVRAALAKDLALEDQSACRSLATIVAESNSVPGLVLPGLGHPSYTRQALNKLIVGKTASDDDRALKKKLLDNLNVMHVKLFVLDPVPGGNIATVGRIGWQEDCFYKALPSFVSKKQELVQKHETSNCFKPIIPLDMPYEVIPGCHGTGDGNQFDHNGDEVPADKYPNRDLSGVQDLVLRRWFDLTFPEAMPEFKIDLGHQGLDAVANAYLPKPETCPEPEKGRCDQLLANYEAIQENHPAFEWLATRNYDKLGQYMAERQVHYHMRGNTPITGLDAYGDGETFMNLQHVQLWMSKQLKSFNFFEKTLVEQIQWLTVNLDNAFTTNSGTEAHTEEWMVTKLLKNPVNHPMIQESLSFLINTVTQTFMRNHLTLEQKKACQQCVEGAFTVLKTCSESTHPNHALAKQVEQAIRRDLTTTMIRHQNSLMSVSQQLLRDQESIINDFNLPEEDRKAIDSPLNWMVGAQKVYQELGFLAEQTAALEPWCSEDLLKESWGKMLPNFSDKIEGTPELDSCKANLKSYISQQKKLILASAIELLSKMPDALQNKPRGLDDTFYKLIHRQANISNLEADVKKLEKDAKAEKEAMAQLAQQSAEEKDSLLKKCEAAEARVKALNTPEQETALLKVVALKKQCQEYLKRLKDTDDGSDLQKDKVIAVNDMLDTLKDSTLLPADRLSDFHLKVENENTQELLKEHRDPEWQRFFRDCLRILARVFSGVGFYRMAKGESPQFFKPSHGELFVEDALLKSAPTA